MKKHILFINGHLNTGGAEKSLLDILRCIDYSKYDVELLLLEDTGDYADEVPKEVCIRLFDLHNTYGSLMKSLVRCLKAGDWKNFRIRILFFLTKWFGKEILSRAARIIIGKTHYDCVVGFRPGIASELAAYAAGADRRITWWHHGAADMNDAQAEDYRKICKSMDRVVAVSQGCRQMLCENFPSLMSKIIVIPNMIDSEYISSKADAYVPYDKTDGETILVTVGRLSSEKHLENAVCAAFALKQRGIKFRWYIVGEGDERPALEKLIAEKELCGLVILSGSQANPYPYMKHADLLVHTSYVESQCLAVLEAMSLGVPCVVTESVGPGEFAVHMENCWLTEQNEESLRNGVVRMITNRELRQSIAERGRETAARYDKDRIYPLIDQLLDGGSPAKAVFEEEIL